MDVFIRDALAAFLKSNPKYEFNVVVEDAVGVVAMYIISAGIFVDKDGVFENIPYGKPWAYLDEDFMTVSAYHSKDYSAIPFYEKQGFFAIQEYSDEYDTLRMVLRV